MNGEREERGRESPAAGPLFEEPCPLTYAIRVRPEQVEAARNALAGLGIRMDPRLNLIAVNDRLHTVAEGGEAPRYLAAINEYLTRFGLEPTVPGGQENWPPERLYDFLRLAANEHRWREDGSLEEALWPGECGWADIVFERERTFRGGPDG